MSHAPFGHDVIGKFLYVFAGPFQNRHLHAAFVVQVNVKRGLRQIMMIVEIASEFALEVRVGDGRRRK